MPGSLILLYGSKTGHGSTSELRNLFVAHIRCVREATIASGGSFATFLGSLSSKSHENNDMQATRRPMR
jgi:hypothetical protein